MSHTTSRGYHTSRRWVAPAMAVKESLEQNTLPPRGALLSMECFFYWMLAGIDQDQGIKSKVYPAAAESALQIGQTAFSSVYRIHAPMSRVKTRGKAYLRLLENIRIKGRLPDPGLGRSEIGRLQIFLRILIEQGQISGGAYLI